ncbi:RpiR family carbohydrate utilization transcriptional regulator [Chitinivorax tropicus]|uniref:RpiR family carbohydrate utilization transcriptional regulator n=1 Tax=Chitinivorax tropicus TaxID=714531 RepID=A0A840MIS7_9PROT|nr:transcriptional regulator HexR [Chitinivorax tropicus]MBB5017099.1 RpiR family carbohydrate utilization transcriptional regulator [Chitinivorax tropicus]
MLNKIQEVLDSLSKSERKVAELVLAQPNMVASAPIAAIADQAGVSQPTVIRFCRSLDCNGLQDFKLRLTKSLVSGVPYVHQSVMSGDSPHDLIAKVFDNCVSSLLRTRNEMNPDSLQQAVGILASANKIEFYGLGNSGIIAADAQHKFFRLGVPTVSYSDPHIHGMAATMLQPGDAVVAISNTGRTADLIRSVQIAREVGAKVVGITRSNSPLAQYCHVALYADTPEDPDIYTPMVARIVHLAIIDALAVGVSLRRGPELIRQLEQVKRILKEKRVRGFE